MLQFLLGITTVTASERSWELKSFQPMESCLFGLDALQGKYNKLQILSSLGVATDDGLTDCDVVFCDPYCIVFLDLVSSIGPYH